MTNARERWLEFRKTDGGTYIEFLIKKLNEAESVKADAETLAALVLINDDAAGARPPYVYDEILRLARKLAPETVKRAEPGDFVPGIHPIDFDENGNAHIKPAVGEYYKPVDGGE